MENENEMNEFDISIIENAKRISQKLLDKGEKILPVCMVFNKDKTSEIIGMSFDGGKSKEMMREMLKKQLLQKDLEKYVIIFDTKMTTMDKSGRTRKVQDAIFISIYSPKYKIARGFTYGANRKIKDNEKDVIKIDGRDEKAGDMWDIWGKGIEESEVQESYINYKKLHPELYRGVDTKQDEIYDLRVKGKAEVIDIGMGFTLKIYRLNNRVFFQCFNAEGTPFLSSKIMDEDKEFKENLNEVVKTIKMVGGKFDEE